MGPTIAPMLVDLLPDGDEFDDCALPVADEERVLEVVTEEPIIVAGGRDVDGAKDTLEAALSTVPSFAPQLRIPSVLPIT